MGLSEAFDTINRTIIWKTMYKKAIPTDMAKHIRRGQQGKTTTQIKRKIWRTARENVGVFQGSAISALLFIIYMDDVMEDNASQIRRSNLPTRIAPDRPQKLETHILWGAIKAQYEIIEPLQEQQIIRTIQKYDEQKRKDEKQHNRTAAQRKRKRNQDIDARNKTEGNGPEKKTEMTTDIEEDHAGGGSFQTKPINRSARERSPSRHASGNPSKKGRNAAGWNKDKQQ